jgi:hypothetical protein
VADIPGNQAPKAGFAALRQWAGEIFAGQKNKATNPEIGDVVLDMRAVRDSAGHSMNADKAEAFVAVKDVIEQGRIVQRGEKNGVASIYITAPIRIGGKDTVVIVQVNSAFNRQGMYLHSVETKESLQNNRVKTGGITQTGSVLTGPATLGGAYSVVQNALNVNPDSVSKVIDEETGEPLVVYHGTGDKFTTFDRGKLGSRENKFFFTSNKNGAKEYAPGREPMALFLNAPNLEEFTEENFNHRKTAEEGVDYVLDRDTDWNEYAVSRPNQIKSATANTGAFSAENDDIRYSQGKIGHGLPAPSTGSTPLDGRRLAALRRAAAGLERPKDGIFLRVDADGRAIATGPKGARIPETFRRFAQDNGLAFFAGRRLPKYAEGTPAANISGEMSSNSEAMPIDYRESGALYFGEMRGGETLDRTGNTLFSQPANREGRAQPLTAQVLTPSGYRLMSDIHVGDEVIAVDGSATAVTGVYPQGVQPIYRITLSDGSTTRATFDHLWVVRPESSQGFMLLSTSELIKAMKAGRRYAIHPLGERFGMAAGIPGR